MLRVFLCLALAVLASGASAQAPEATRQASGGRVVAVFAEEAPRVDGHLDEGLWGDMEPITQFIQVWPEDGSASTEKTEVRIAYDQDFLYFAFTNLDREPHLIRAKNLERGGRNDRDDHVYIGLDTYQDGRNAYLFEMNALGTQDDATVTDEGLTIDSFSWDAVFRSETVIDENGWTMEVAIPFRQLRFPEGDDLSFGLMLSRTINRKNERVMWPRIGLEHANSSFGALSVVSRYGTLSGLKNIRRGRNLEIKPYVISSVQQSREDLAFPETETEFQHDLGVDIKYGLTSSLTLDATVNTDFAQVEADNVQIDLTRFALFFPEKREFFLERSGLFEHGNSRSTQTFFSRRIGLSESILAGARVTGQVGPFSGGILNIETGPNRGDIFQDLANIFGTASSNNTVARVRADVLPRTTVGAITTNLSDARGSNTALGVDAQARFGTNSSAEAWFTNVWDTDPGREGAAGHVRARYETDRVAAQASYTSVGETYRPALGFVRRPDMRQTAGQALYRQPIPAVSFLRRASVQSDVSVITGQDGVLQTRDVGGSLVLDFDRRDVLAVGLTQTFERLAAPFDIRPDDVSAVIEEGDYTFTRLAFRGTTDSSRPVFASVEGNVGPFFGGNRTDVFGLAGWRQSQHLALEGTVLHTIVSLPVTNGDFTATTLSTSILGAINRNLFAKALIQYDNFSRDIQANIRIDWIHTPGSDLFIVLNTGYHLGAEGEDLFDPRRDVVLRDRTAIAKLTYLVLL